MAWESQTKGDPDRNPYLNFRDRQELAREMGLPDYHFRVWFQNCSTCRGAVRKLVSRQRPYQAKSTLASQIAESFALKSACHS